MNRIGAMAVAMLVTLSMGAESPTKPEQAQPQPTIRGGEAQIQSSSPPTGMPTFHSEARFVLITAGVWKRTPDKHPDESLVSTAILREYPPNFFGPLGVIRYAERLDTKLRQSDFHIFDNGTEQPISYFRETVLPLRDVTQEERVAWRFSPTGYGTWGYPPGYLFPRHESAPPPPGFPPPGRYAFEGPDITYVVGYVPPALEPGKCHDIRIEVKDHEVGLDRNQYCALVSARGVDEPVQVGADVPTDTRTLADSSASGSIKVSAETFVFRSSNAYYFKTQSAAAEAAIPESSDPVYALQMRDSKAPARVHVAVEFVLPRNGWIVNCGRKPSLHVIGIAYKENHQVAGQFGDTLTCSVPELVRKRMEIRTNGSKDYKSDFPSRLDTQMDLGPGDYDLRLAVSTGEKEFGTSRVPLHVDSFDSQQLAISDVVLSSFPRAASKVFEDLALISPAQLVPAPLLSKNIQFLPDTDTRLSLHMRLPLYFEIYEPLLKEQTIDVHMRLRVTNLKNGSVVLDSGLLSANHWILPGNVVIPVGFSLGTENLDKGSYRVDVQVSDAQGRESPWRGAHFTIE